MASSSSAGREASEHSNCSDSGGDGGQGAQPVSNTQTQILIYFQEGIWDFDVAATTTAGD